MAKHESRDNEAQPDELGNDPGQVGSDSAGQSGDTQGLSQIADAAAESVEELADTDQAYEAEAIGGVEDAVSVVIPRQSHEIVLPPSFTGDPVHFSQGLFGDEELVIAAYVGLRAVMGRNLLGGLAVVL